MPITARLSRRFYETFGDEIVNELVEWLNQVDLAFRSELRDAHELGLQRLEAKVDQRFAELRAEVRERLRGAATNDDLVALRVAMNDDLVGFRVATKEDLAALRLATKEDFAALRAELKGDLAAVRAELKEDLAALRGELKDDIRSLQVSMGDLRADLIKWMFLFWVGTAGITLATRFLR